MIRRLLLRYRHHDRVAYALLELWKYRPSQLLKRYRLAIGYGASGRRFVWGILRAALTLPFSWHVFDFDRVMYRAVGSCLLGIDTRVIMRA